MTDGWVPDPRQDFGARLALVRQHHAWNIKRAADECGVNPISWRLWETRQRMPRDYPMVCQQISERSGCELVWLMTGGRQVTHDCVARAMFGLAA